MKELFLFLGFIIASVRAGSITEEYFDGVRRNFSSSTFPQGETHYKASFNNLYTIETRTLNSSFMEFQITAGTSGWVGIVLNPTRPSLTGGDVLIAGIHDNSGEPYFNDMHGDANGELRIDSRPNSDWIYVSGFQFSMPNRTKLVFHRRYKTNDPNTDQDYSITKEETVHFMGVMGQEDNQFPILVNAHVVGSSKVNFVKDGTGTDSSSGGLTGSFTFILTIASIKFFKMF